MPPCVRSAELIAAFISTACAGAVTPREPAAAVRRRDAACRRRAQAAAPVPVARSSGCPETAAPPLDAAGGSDSGRPPGWRMVNSGAGRVGGGCPSDRGSVARISGRCTGPSSSSLFDVGRRRRPDAASGSTGHDRAALSGRRPTPRLPGAARAASPRRRPTAVARVAAVRHSCATRLGRRRAPARTAPRASPSSGAGAAPWRACIRARRRTSCSASASRPAPTIATTAWLVTPPLARTVIVQNVTKPKLALLHQNLPKPVHPAGGGETSERRSRNLSRAGFPDWQ